MKATIAALTMERMTRNMPICLAEVAISLATRMSSISARVQAVRCFQRSDFSLDFIGGRVAGGEADQHGIDIVAGGLAGQHGIEQTGDAGAVERRVGSGAGTLGDQAVVVLEKLDFLRILERDEDHRVAGG